MRLWEKGFAIPQDSPSLRARLKKVAVIESREGNPKEILETPMDVLNPFLVNILNASKVTFGDAGSEITVRVNGSTIKSFFSRFPK